MRLERSICLGIFISFPLCHQVTKISSFKEEMTQSLLAIHCMFADVLEHTEFAAFSHSVPTNMKSVVQMAWKKLVEITGLCLL